MSARLAHWRAMTGDGAASRAPAGGVIARLAYWRAMTAPPRRQPSPAGTSRHAPVAVARTVAGRLGAWAVVAGMVVYTGTFIVRFWSTP